MGDILKKSKRKKRKLKVKKFFVFLLFVFIIVGCFYYIINIKITSIIVVGNQYFSDQEIIDMAGISAGDKVIDKLPFEIEKKISKNELIISSSVKIKGFFNEIYINIKENPPILYYLPKNKTVLSNSKLIDKELSNTILINIIPDKLFDKLISKLSKIDKDILNRISEIKYEPNDVDDERLLLIMNDQNYVYITISKIDSINKYIDMIKAFDDKKGILHLDSGDYFEVFK